MRVKTGCCGAEKVERMMYNLDRSDWLPQIVFESEVDVVTVDLIPFHICVPEKKYKKYNLLA